jgi:hypothetical protein
MSATLTSPFRWIESTSWELDFFGLPHRIPWRVDVRYAVHLDDQPRRREVEIGDVRTKRDLPPKLQSNNLMPAKSLPKLSFGRCLCSAH